MLDSAEDFRGKVTFISGPEKHCGKTTFMNRAAAVSRKHSSPALLTVGYDGEARDFLSGARKPAVPVGAGDLFVTTERFAMAACPEILDVLPGGTALGRLCLARAGRAATIALVGPEGNHIVAWAIEQILADKLTDTIFVDGAINRITQAASIGAACNASLVYVLRVDPSTIVKSIARMRRLFTLMRLPLGETPVNAESEYVFHGALSSDTAAALQTGLPKKIKTIIVDDFTKIFLSDTELDAFMRERSLKIKRRISFGGFSVICRGLSNEAFAAQLDDVSMSQYVTYNGYEV